MPSTYDNPQNPGLDQGMRPKLTRELMQLLQAYAETKVEVLRNDQPELFRYSDLLGERPIDGFIRQLDVWALDKQMKQDTEYMQQFKHNQTIEQNRRVAPGFTGRVQDYDEAGRALPPDQRNQKIMGPVM